MLTANKVDLYGVAFCRSCLPQDRFQELLAPLERVRRGALPVVELPPHRQSHVLGLLQELEREQSRSSGALPIVAESLLGLLLAEIVRAAPLDAAPSEAPRSSPRPSP